MARFNRTSQNIPQFNDYTRYRPYLRKDFQHKCAYCEMTEASVFGIETFGVDHFKPKKAFPNLICTYGNLYYCCNDCNRFKGPIWPSEQRMADGYFFPDPCLCDPQQEHLKEKEDAQWQAITNAGTFALEVMRLNREPCLRFRRKRQSVLRRIALYRELLPTLDPQEIRDLLNQVLADLEIECTEYYA